VSAFWIAKELLGVDAQALRSSVSTAAPAIAIFFFISYPSHVLLNHCLLEHSLSDESCKKCMKNAVLSNSLKSAQDFKISFAETGYFILKR
jgi:hypothetical protein